MDNINCPTKFQFAPPFSIIRIGTALLVFGISQIVVAMNFPVLVLIGLGLSPYERSQATIQLENNIIT